MQGPYGTPDSDFNILTLLDRWHYNKSKDALLVKPHSMTLKTVALAVTMLLGQAPQGST